MSAHLLKPSSSTPLIRATVSATLHGLCLFLPFIEVSRLLLLCDGVRIECS